MICAICVICERPFFHIVRFLLFLLLLPLSAAAQKKTQYAVTAVAFYNLENLFDPADDPRRFDEDFTPTGPYAYTEEIYRQKLHNLAFALSKIGVETVPDGPAFFGVTEVENEKVLLDLLAQPELKARGLRHVWFEGPDMRGIDVAFLYDPRRFKLIAARALKVNLSDNGDVKSNGTRDVLHVTGSLLGDTVHVFVNHWPSRRGGEAASAPLRARAAAVPRAVIDSLIGESKSTRAIVMGDLNDDPVSPSVTRVLRATGDRKKVNPSTLWNPWLRFYRDGIGTLGYADAWNLFDQILFTHPFLEEDPAHWRYYKAEVFNRDFLIQKFGQYKGYAHRSFGGTTWLNGYSDHFPTVVYLVKPAAGQ